MRYINLSRGLRTIVDGEDYERINQWKWCAWRHTLDGHFYAVRNSIDTDGKKIRIWMHREIMRTPTGLHVDHINGDGLDNRSANLRNCKSSENMRNQNKHKNNTSGFKGVSWRRASKKWVAYIRVDGELKHLGYYHTTQNAARAYNEAAIKYHGSFARLNKIPMEVL
jgi:hypothetical protein